MASTTHSAIDDAAGDAELVQAAVTPDVVRTLVENQRAFLAFLERRTGDRELARDIMQEAFLRGFEKLESLRDDEAAVAWFYRMLRNAVVDVRRRRGSAQRALAAFEAELGDALEPAREVQDTICACVKRLATTMRPAYADALQRVEVDGVAVKDYAAEAGITAGAAAVRVFRARDALRKQVERSCGACATHGCLDCTCGQPPDASPGV
ncbi:MAG: sigma-70 family RNA polymerase sigma factor [Polyangiaceae bacterium]